AHQIQFPQLAKMAYNYLAIPATSVSSERLFSSEEIMISDKKFNLVPKTIRASQCLKS
ncbi:2164_t:CDS:1, partial [Ambispora gerdemannii]